MAVFIKLKKYYKQAIKGKYALGAFNTSGLEVSQAIAEAAKEMNAPVIFQTTPSAIEYAGLNQIFSIIKNEIIEKDIKAVIHLDHGKDFGVVKACVDAGYPSVMIDGSYLDYHSNIALTKKVVVYAHKYDVVVEGELGVIGKEGNEGGKMVATYTDPMVIIDFVKKTGVDSLAVSVGNRHGAPEGEKIDFPLLKKIAKITPVPLVMHGASGLSKKAILEAKKYKVVKFNIDTQIRQEFLREIVKNDKKICDPRDALCAARDGIKKIVSQYISIFGSKNKA